MERYMGFLRLDVPRPVLAGGYGGMEFQVEVCTAGYPVPAYVRASSAGLYGSGFRDLRGRTREHRARRLYEWLLDRALTFAVAGGAAHDLRAYPVDPDRADHLPYVPVPVLDPARLEAPLEEVLSGRAPLTGLAPGAAAHLRLLLVGGRLWGPFVAAQRAAAGLLVTPDPEGLSCIPLAGQDTEVLVDGHTCFVRQDHHDWLVRHLGAQARADALARRRVVGTAVTRTGRPEFRSISQVYEGWCLVQLAATLEQLGFAVQPGRHTGPLQQALSRRSVPLVPAGAEFTLADRHGRRLRLLYDAELPHTQFGARSRRSEFFAATPHNRPDYRLERLDGDRCVRALVLDAKRRRLAHLWDESQYTPVMEQLHSYAFGVRHRDRPLEPVVRGAIALFSGHGGDAAWVEAEGGAIVLARLAPGLPNPQLRERLRRFAEEG